MSFDLERFPRLSLGRWPTPLEEAPRLAEALGLKRVLIKRDDVNPLGAGGNKLRKLEFLLGQALADGVDTVITFGALQTNHGRLTAAACAKLGLRCELVLTAKVPMDGDAYERSGNITLDRMFGANVHICADAEETGKVYDSLIAEATGKVATFPVGGSSPVGALGYVAAAEEIRGQLEERGIGKARIVVPLGSAGTAAGIVLGWPWGVDLACVGHPADESRESLELLVGDTARLLGVPKPSLGQVRISDRALGPGYGVPTERMWQALGLFGRTEGVALDPVYTGKAAAMLVEWAAAEEIDEPVVFLHTGGLPGLFGYGPQADAAFG